MAKIVETPTTNELPAVLFEVASALALNLAQSEPFLKFHEADRKLHANPEAVRLLTEITEVQQKIRSQQYANAVSESDINRLRVLQQAIASNQIIQAQAMAQQEATDFLREVNEKISNLIGIDFAPLTRRAGGCC